MDLPQPQPEDSNLAWRRRIAEAELEDMIATSPDPIPAAIRYVRAAIEICRPTLDALAWRGHSCSAALFYAYYPLDVPRKELVEALDSLGALILQMATNGELPPDQVNAIGDLAQQYAQSAR